MRNDKKKGRVKKGQKPSRKAPAKKEETGPSIGAGGYIHPGGCGNGGTAFRARIGNFPGF